MEITRFSQEIQDLYQQQKPYLQLWDPKVLDVLREMEKKALELGDDELLGYVYHSIAFAEYFIAGNYEGFLKNVRLSASHLLNCEDPSELIHVYYLIGLDAMNKGIYDLSYHFFLKACNIAEETGQETSVAILEENIGNILIIVGAYEEARGVFQKSLRGIMKDPSHPHYYNNVATCHMNEAWSCLGMGLLSDAEESCEKTRVFMEENAEAFQIDARINIALLEAEVALRKGDSDGLRAIVTEIIQLVQQVPQMANYMEELKKLVLDLMDAQELAPADELIKVISSKDLADDATNAGRSLNEMKVRYFEIRGNEEELLNCYLEQDEILRRLMEHQVDSSAYAQDLIALTNEIQQEQERVKKQREELLYNAGMDILTGLPNRYAGDLKMDEVFERACKEKTSVGACLLDLDGLKECNDTLGHQAGDELLKDMANALKTIAQDHGVHASRYGGDEFVIICENMEHDEILRILDRIHQLTTVKFSVGVCNGVPREKMRAWDFLKMADDELYDVKNGKAEGRLISDISIRQKPLQVM